MTLLKRRLALSTIFAAFFDSVVNGRTEEARVCRDDQVEDTGVCIPIRCPEYNVEHKGIEHYLNPDLLKDPKTLQDVAERLQSGELVVIRDALLPEFAEALHCDLATSKAFKHYLGSYEVGFSFSHHNVYDRRDFSKLLNDTGAVFNHPDSKQFMEELSYRDCSGRTSGSASHYQPGDHSLPHSDHVYQRTVAYVWHLAKNWKPEWGGALYWGPDDEYVHASFNTLSLFSVHPDATHFVTTVSPDATEKRLSFNGWYTSSWVPSLDDELEEIINVESRRWDLTSAQVDQLRALIYSNNDNISEERLQGLMDLMTDVENELWPPQTNRLLVVEY